MRVGSTKHPIVLTVGILAPILAWGIVKWGFGVSDRYLPGPGQVVSAASELEPSVWMHTAKTATRLLAGFVLGTLFGITVALMCVRVPRLQVGLTPFLQSVRAVPAAAVVPLFLLWFGFSEWGRYLLVVTAIGFNIAIAALQVVQDVPPVHAAFFKSFRLSPGQLPIAYCLPRMVEGLLPTMRFSMVVAIGAVTVSELLGSQHGLGYLIQTSRATYSLHVLVLAILILGLMNAVADATLVWVWRRVVFWRVQT